MREVPLTRGLVAIVDDADFEPLLAAGPWHAYPSGQTHYARHSRNRDCQLTMHGFLTGWPRVDHVNGNGLDNRRGNLRLATASTNGANRGPQRNNTSGFKGVHQNRSTGRWIAQLGVGGRRLRLGTFDTAIEAALIYDAAAREHFGEFARLNFPTQEMAS